MAEPGLKLTPQSQGWWRFLNMLRRPPAPNEKLRKLAEKYAREVESR